MADHQTHPAGSPVPRPGAHGGLIGRLEGWVHRAGVRLLSQSLMPLLVWLLMLASLAVNAATLPSLYDAVIPISLAVAVLQSASLVWAMTRPRLAVGGASIAVGATTILTAVGRGTLPWPIPVVTLVTLAFTVFVLALRHRWMLPVAGALLPVAAATLAGLPVHTGGWGGFTTNLITALSILALVVTFGILIHQWLLSRAELLEQQEITAAAHERHLLMEERNRIARELHDVVAHGLSVISIQASTMQYRVEDVPTEVVAEMDEITDAARRSLVEMRGLLAVLRQEGADRELAPQPTMASVPALVESTRRSAEAVRLTVVGELDDPRVSEATSLTVYRIVQEALSNALRHAPGAEIDVAITIGDRIAVEIGNTPPSAPASPTRGDGFGLRGMRERASFVGGELHAGPTAEGGFRVRAMLPARPGGDRGETIEAPS